MKINKRFFHLLLLLLLVCFGFTLASAQPAGQSNKFGLGLIAVVPQPDSPIVIIPTDVDNSYQYNLKINYDIKNISEKRVKAFVIIQHNSTSEYSGRVDYFHPIEIGRTIGSWNTELKVNLKPDSKIYLSVGYILFADETSWSTVPKDEVEFIYGLIEGQKKILSELKIMAKTDKVALSKLLEQQAPVANLKNLNIDKTKSDEWKFGFEIGCKMVLAQLKDISEKIGIDMLPLEPEDFYNSIEPMRIGR
jgi:hypothetical protein